MRASVTTMALDASTIPQLVDAFRAELEQLAAGSSADPKVVVIGSRLQDCRPLSRKIFELRLSPPRMDLCGECDGAGTVVDDWTRDEKRCPSCEGTGTVAADDEDGAHGFGDGQRVRIEGDHRAAFNGLEGAVVRPESFDGAVVIVAVEGEGEIFVHPDYVREVPADA